MVGPVGPVGPVGESIPLDDMVRPLGEPVAFGQALALGAITDDVLAVAEAVSIPDCEIIVDAAVSVDAVPVLVDPVALLVGLHVGVPKVGRTQLRVPLLAQCLGPLGTGLCLTREALGLELALLGLDPRHLGARLRLRGARLALAKLAVPVRRLLTQLGGPGTFGLSPACT